MSIHILSFIGIVAIAVLCPFWVFIACAVVYTFFYTAYELLIIALCIDAQFGEPAAGIWCWYSISVSVILIMMTYIKPHLRFYQ